MEWMILALFALIVFGVAGVYLGSAIAIAGAGAGQRGYSLALWLAAGLNSLNPVIFLAVLALMPNRGRRRMREQFRTELEAKLAARTGRPLVPATAVAPQSLAGSTLPERSLGDMPTVAPTYCSVGDDVTRG